MVQKNSIEKFIQRAVWRLTRSSDIIKYVPKELKNGILVGDCAVLRNKTKTYDIYSKQRLPLKKDIYNYKLAVCIATILNQYTKIHEGKLKELDQLDLDYSIAIQTYERTKSQIQAKPHLEDKLDDILEEIYQLDTTIQQNYAAMTL